MTVMTEGASGADRRARIEAVLAHYPHIDAEALEDLIGWFRKEASALDVGMIASEPSLARQYQQFKEDHLGKFSGSDLILAAIIVLVGIGAIALLIRGVL